MIKTFDNHSFLTGINKPLRFVDQLEEFVEGFGLPRRYLLEINVSAIAKNLSEEMETLLFIEQIVFRVVASLTVLINPLQEKSLVRVEVRLLNKQGPQTVDVFNAESYLLI
jgi:hypothetical protein